MKEEEQTQCWLHEYNPPLVDNGLYRYMQNMINVYSKKKSKTILFAIGESCDSPEICKSH